MIAQEHLNLQNAGGRVGNVEMKGAVSLDVQENTNGHISSRRGGSHIATVVSAGRKMIEILFNYVGQLYFFFKKP